MKIKAYSYTRMSTDKQKAIGESDRRQIELSEQYCKQNNFELVTDYREIAGISAFKGLNAASGMLRAFINAVKEKQIKEGSFLLIENIDRLSRQPVLTSIELVQEIIRLNISIVTITDGQIYNTETLNENNGLMFILVGGMQRANSESKTKSLRLKASWKNKVANIKTKPLTSKCPFWITLDKSTNTFSLNENSYIAKKIFELSLIGFGDSKISRYLNEHGIKNPTGLVVGWTKGYINKILKYHAAYGALKTATIKDPIKNYFPAIITEDEFNLSHQMIQQRKIKGGGNKGRFNNIFTKLLKCSCGSKFIYMDRNTAQYLKCFSVENRTGCKAHTWLYKDFEQSFLKYCSEFNLGEIFNNDETVKQKEKLRESLRLLDSKRLTLKVEYDLMVERFAVVPDSILNDLIKLSEAKKEEMLQLDEKITEANALMLLHEQEVNSIKFSDNIRDYTEAIKGKTTQEIYTIREKLHYSISSIIDSITIHNNKYWQTGDYISTSVVEGLHGRKYKTDSAMENYLLTDSGQRFYDEFNRYYVIKFKNGQKRNVIPFQDYSKSSSQVKESERQRELLNIANLKRLEEQYGIEIDLDKLVNL